MSKPFILHTRVLPDGTTIELTRSGAVTGPDQIGGQHYGTSYLYYRVNCGPWINSPFRSDHTTLDRLAECESYEVFRKEFEVL